jgi:signal transduction histidine kinase
MRGAASVIEAQGGSLGPGGQDALRAMNAGGDRAQRYVDDLLDVVRAAGEPLPGPLAADLDQALDAALADLQPFLARGPVHVQREPVPRAALDPQDARRLFAHLLRGALAAGATRLGAGGRAEAGRTLIDLFDNGEPPSAGADPFAPFARPRGRGPLVGAGVSLPVCRRLVERAGGTIDLVVRSDGATIVSLELPAP